MALVSVCVLLQQPSPYFRFQNETIFKEWQSRLFNRRAYRSTDRICERHFTKDQILTHWDHVIDGKVVKLEREKPRLKENAIPQLNMESRSAKRTRPPAPKSQKVKRIERRPVNAVAATDEEVDAPNDINHENHAEAPGSDEEVVDVHIEKLNGSESDAIIDETQTDPVDAARKRQIFEAIYDDIYEVVLPSTQWGIHRDPDQNFLAFTQFDFAQMNCVKSLCVSNTFNVQATIHGTSVMNEMADELSVEYLSKTLSALDDHEFGQT